MFNLFQSFRLAVSFLTVLTHFSVLRQFGGSQVVWKMVGFFLKMHPTYNLNCGIA